MVTWAEEFGKPELENGTWVFNFELFLVLYSLRGPPLAMNFCFSVVVGV